MRVMTNALVAAALVMSISACTAQAGTRVVVRPAAVVVTPVVYAPRRPPVLRVEAVPARPRGAWNWQPGHWVWVQGDYAWVPGRYVARPARASYWVAPRWVVSRGVWVFKPGFWRYR
jgi:WXXGXW repeat (2 copies)